MKVLTRFCATFFLLVSNSLWAQDLVGFDADSFGDIVLKRNQFAGSDTYQKYEAQVGAYNNEPITNYSANSVFAKIGRSVGRLDILTDVGVFPCTAFIIGENLLMTNYHCVPGIIEDDRAKATRIDGVQFVAGYTQTGVEEGTRKYTVVPQPLEADKNLDYAILRSIGAPQVEFGQLKLSSRRPEERDPYWVIGHPMGEALRISREKCRANSPAQSKGRLLHTCDTLPGNSGSPLIDASSRTVVGLHNAGSEKNEVNFAIPMYEILQNSKLAVDSPQKTVVTGGESGSALCDTLYTEAKFHAQCFAYRAYAERCSDHAFIGFASFYLEEHCAEAVEPVAKVLLRTWCDRETLSEAEKAVCGDRDLSQLDGQHEALSTALEGKPPKFDKIGQNMRVFACSDRVISMV